MSLNRALLTLVAVTVLTPLAHSQRATPEQMQGLPDRPDYYTIHLNSNLGSFKMYGEGAVTVNFTGTILVSQLQGNVSYTGTVKEEYEGLGRQIFHGKGQIKVTGKWRAIQWFGSDMDAVWYGGGFMRIMGEFDRDLKTGLYWYEDAEDKKPWQTFLFEVYLPELRRNVAPGVAQKRGGRG